MEMSVSEAGNGKVKRDGPRRRLGVSELLLVN
jgi:hypothetical protein